MPITKAGSVNIGAVTGVITSGARAGGDVRRAHRRRLRLPMSAQGKSGRRT
jgi:hypothetical protein